MKKILLLCSLVGLILSSCSTYTCPTYGAKPASKEQIQLKNV